MHDPGERFTYGISTDVLGRIVEPLTGVPLDEFVAAQIAAPLRAGSMGWRPPAESGRLAALHARRDRDLVEIGGKPAAEVPRGGGGMYAAAEDYLGLLRMLLNGGLTDGGERLLGPESVTAITTNQIGALFARRQTAAFVERSLDFDFLDGTQKYGFNVMIETRPRPEGRPAGSYGWAGIFNTYFWVDPEAGLAAVLLMQLSPFCDPACLQACRQFERAVYRRR
jgi:methyl acetate hydrolase